MQNHLLPLPSQLPTFEAAIHSLGRVPEILYRGLEFGALKTKGFKDSEFPDKTKLDACLSASVFRAHGIEYLRREGIDAKEDGCQWTFNNLPFLGISFYYNQKHVRILKGPDGLLPGCGHSRKKKKFYDQHQTRYLVGNEIKESDANLIVLWDFDSAYALAHLWMVLPARGGKRPQDVSAYWCEPIKHPAEMPAPKPEPTPIDDGLDNLIKPKTDIKDDDDTGTK